MSADLLLLLMPTDGILVTLVLVVGVLALGSIDEFAFTEIALSSCIIAFSSREPEPTSLENALAERLTANGITGMVTGLR